jgi:hypothetical protein
VGETFTFTEPTTVLRDWMRTLTAITVDVWAGGIPSGETEGVVLTRIGGNIDVTDDGIYQLDCWATTAPRAAVIAGQVVTALVAEPPQTMAATVAFCGVGSVSALPLFDPSAPDRYRIAVTAEITTKTIP